MDSVNYVITVKFIKDVFVVKLTKFKRKTMASKNLWLSLAALVAFVVFSIANVSAMAFAQIVDIEVGGVDTLACDLTGAELACDPVAVPVATFSGQTVPVRVEFDALENAEDVRVKAWIAGERELASISERFDVISGNTYSRLVSLQVPADLDELDETLELNVVIENRNDGIGDEKQISLTLQRESYVIEILDVDMPNEISAGEVLPLDVVLKNIGRHFADETFVRAKIDALGIEDKAFFGDLSSIDEPFSRDPFEADISDGFDRLDKEDSGERKLLLRIPSNAQPGVYVVEIEAYNEDALTTLTRKVVIKGAEDSSMVVAPVHSRSFAVGENGEYTLTIVNTGNRVRVYELIVESPAELSIDLSDPVLAVPAGSSMTARLTANADKAGKYDFAVNVHSGAEVVKRESFMANVEGQAIGGAVGSSTVLLTVVLAIIFIVLLIVLIVLLTRKPEKTEEGESYY